MAKAKLKSLTFSTTLRNPERYLQFLQIIKNNGFDGKILTKSLIDKIVATIIKEAIYNPRTINVDFSQKSLDEIITILDKHPQSHKEAGFKPGWHSRFDTWYKPIMELGFLEYEPDEVIRITETGIAMLEEPNLEQIYFLNAMIRMKFTNPFRKATNETSPVPLLINVLEHLENKIHKNEIPLLLCAPSNDTNLIVETIKKARTKEEFKKREYIYYTCLNWQGDPSKSYLKRDKLFRESTDDFVRKMRFIGIIEISNSGYSISLNSSQPELISYINSFLEHKTFASKSEYIQYLSTIDREFISIIDSMHNIYEEKEILEHWDDILEAKDIICMIQNLASQKVTKKPSSFILGSFRYSLDEVDNPILLEFLVALYVYKMNPKWNVIPNCLFDSNYIPYFHAPGGRPDIEFQSHNMKYAGIVEVSLIRGKTQLPYEAIPICRHLMDYRESNMDKEVFGIYLSPVEHRDVTSYFEFEYSRSGIKFSHHLLSDIETLKTLNEYI